MNCTNRCFPTAQSGAADQITDMVYIHNSSGFQTVANSSCQTMQKLVCYVCTAGLIQRWSWCWEGWECVSSWILLCHVTSEDVMIQRRPARCLPAVINDDQFWVWTNVVMAELSFLQRNRCTSGESSIQTAMQWVPKSYLHCSSGFPSIHFPHMWVRASNLNVDSPQQNKSALDANLCILSGHDSIVLHPDQCIPFQFGKSQISMISDLQLSGMSQKTRAKRGTFQKQSKLPKSRQNSRKRISEFAEKHLQ